MTQEKKEQVFLAGVSLGVLILVLGLIILVFQWVIMFNKNKELKALNREKAVLMQMIEDGEDDIAILQQRATIEELARRLGYKYPEDVEKV